MSSILELLLVWLACLLVSGQSQELFYHDQPHETWRMTFNSIGEGNGLYLTPAKDKLIAVSRSGILRSFSPSDGSVQWTFSPPLISGGSVSCLGGLTFVETVASTYLAYMVVDTINGEASTYVPYSCSFIMFRTLAYTQALICCSFVPQTHSIT